MGQRQSLAAGAGPDRRRPDRDRHPVLPGRGEPNEHRAGPGARSLDGIAPPQARTRRRDRPHRDPSATASRCRSRPRGRRPPWAGAGGHHADRSRSRRGLWAGGRRVRRGPAQVRPAHRHLAGGGPWRRCSATCGPASSRTSSSPSSPAVSTTRRRGSRATTWSGGRPSCSPGRGCTTCTRRRSSGRTMPATCPLADRTVEAALADARRSDLALVGIGAMDAASTLHRGGHVGHADWARLLDAGAVGNINTRFFDAVRHPRSSCWTAERSRSPGTSSGRSRRSSRSPAAPNGPPPSAAPWPPGAWASW